MTPRFRGKIRFLKQILIADRHLALAHRASEIGFGFVFGDNKKSRRSWHLKNTNIIACSSTWAQGENTERAT
jgi:hypothetical protein